MKLNFILKMEASKEVTPTKIFPRNPICMLCSESKDSDGKFIIPTISGCFLGDVTSRCQGLFPPFPFSKEKALGTRLATHVYISWFDTKHCYTQHQGNCWFLSFPYHCCSEAHLAPQRFFEFPTEKDLVTVHV